MIYKRLYLLLIACVAILGYGQAPEKTYLDFMNEGTPVFPGCEDAVNRPECLSTKIGELIVAAINERHATEPFADARIEMEIALRSEASGVLTYSNIGTLDSLAAAVAGNALQQLPEVKPLTDELGDNVTSTHSFVITLQRDYHTNVYSLVQNTKTHEWLKMPHPFVIKHAVIEGCLPEERFLSECFWEHFNVWRAEALKADDFGKFVGQKARLLITVNTDGTTDFTVKGPPKLKKAIEKAVGVAWETFPTIEPATLNGELSEMTYTVPLEF